MRRRPPWHRRRRNERQRLVRLRERCDRAAQQFALDVEQRDAPAFGEKPLGGGKPDPARGAGDKCDFLRGGGTWAEVQWLGSDFALPSTKARLLLSPRRRHLSMPGGSEQRRRRPFTIRPAALFLMAPTIAVSTAPGHAATGHLADNAADIGRRGAIGEQRNQHAEQLSSGAAADGPDDGVCNVPRSMFLAAPGDDIAADGSADNLDDEVDEHPDMSRHSPDPVMQLQRFARRRIVAAPLSESKFRPG